MSSSYAPLSTAEENESNNVNTFSKRFNRMYIKWKLSNLWKSFQGNFLKQEYLCI